MDTEAACLNCNTALGGRYCHACGQRAGHARGSLLHLGGELLETLTHADSRFWRTLRRLALDPAGLSRDYLAGRRASQIPPLRLFFVMLFLLFGIGSLTAGRIEIPSADTAQHQELERDIGALEIPRHPAATSWLQRHLRHATLQPDEVIGVMRDWLERFAILLLPVAGGMLWLLTVNRRQFSLYDHMIVSIHSLCFACFVLIAMMVLSDVSGGIAPLLLLLLPLHLFRHLRGVYRSGIAATLLRMGLLGLGTALALAAMLVGLAALGLELGAAG